MVHPERQLPNKRSGDNFFKERTVRSAFKKGHSMVLLAYEALGGQR
jgi:hypothetical protein